MQQPSAFSDESAQSFNAVTDVQGFMSAVCTVALVKLLRRCVNQMTGKTRQYVDTSIKFEREASQQVCPLHKLH